MHASPDPDPADSPRSNLFAQLVPTREVLEQRLAELTLALERAESRHASELREAAARLTDERAHANERASHTSAELDALRAELVEQATALQRVEQQAAVDRLAAAEDAARRQAKAESDLNRETSTRQAMARAAAAADAALATAEGRHRSELSAMAAHLADQQQQLETRLADAAARLDEQQRQANEQSAQAAAALDALRVRFVEATDALQRAGVQAELDRQSAIETAAARQASFNAELEQLAARREVLTNELADAEVRLRQAEERHVGALEAARSELTAATEKAAIDRQAAIDVVATHQAAIERQTAELGDAARRLAEETGRRETIEQELVQGRAAAEHAQRRFLEASNEMRERAREHALHLEDRTRREQAAWEASLAERQQEIAQLQRDGDLVRQSLVTKEDELRVLRAAHDDQRASFERARTSADADLTRERAACAALREEVEDHRRQYDALPANICRCTPDGTLTQASRTLAQSLGYASSAEFISIGAAVFETADELRWLISRCLSSRSAQSIETTWQKRDGSRIVVRLVAAATPDRSIDLAVEDITEVRALEERLRHAQRLEAVARYASEVAGTCESLLRDVKQAGPQWLSRIDNDSVRHQGERLLSDVNRVSGFLRQLAEYGGKQKQALPLVDVNSVLRDLAAVLKRVAGDHFELILPKDSTPLNLDVEAEQVERILVNVAAYARMRMPLGGRLLIDIAPALLDHEFAERYPSVRPGAHVLFTVTEMKGPTPVANADVLDSDGAEVHDGPGVDLGVLQSLVANCGGHLWIAAEPSGDMVLKIHLPRRALDDRAGARGPARWIGRLVAASR